ncbi:hypothetical protein GCM10023346_32160 [Arthrobacter gyeryongensis]|uniref:Secreted protein n=1 Tax=Arthrobacter gyeryongensis TaxID=1650592 RepID=A0ABP9SLS7_9MICC
MLHRVRVLPCVIVVQKVVMRSVVLLLHSLFGLDRFAVDTVVAEVSGVRGRFRGLLCVIRDICRLRLRDWDRFKVDRHRWWQDLLVLRLQEAFPGTDFTTSQGPGTAF